MWELALANFRGRPARSALSVGSIALGVGLILLFAGLASGEIRERAERDQRVKAEILVYPSEGATFGVLGLPLSLPVSYEASLRQIEGVREVTPVGYFVEEGVGGTGFRAIEGIDFASYARLSDLRIIAGRAMVAEDEALADLSHMRAHRLALGDRISVGGRSFQLVGIYSPEMGARVKVPLRAVQKLRGAPERCSFFLIKCVNPEAEQEVAERLNRRFPELRVVFTGELPRLYRQSIPALDVFLSVLVGVASLIAGLSVFVAMYAAVTERTHEIGVLRSLGAHRRWIVKMIMQEALGMGLVGAVAGILLSSFVGKLLMRATTLSFRLEWRWILMAALTGIGSGLAGAFFPALQAARMDPVVALSKTR